MTENTFAWACVQNNTVNELKEALATGPDQADMNEWGISEQEWVDSIHEAIEELSL